MKVRFLGETSERSKMRRIKNVAGAGKLSHYDGSVFNVIASSKGYDEDIKTIERITKSGHESIIEHDYIQIGISGVTPIVEQVLIGFRLTAFTIKSRRYVDFRKSGYYVPKFRKLDDEYLSEDYKRLKTNYKRHVNSLFKFYSEMVDGGIPKEDARFILPYSFFSEIVMSLSARELKKMIIYLLYSEVSKIDELYELGIRLFGLAVEYVPYIINSIQNYKPTDNEFPEFRNIIASYSQKTEILKEPVLVDHTPEPDNTIITSAIMSELQCNYIEASNIVTDLQNNIPNFKKRFMESITRKSENRELEQVCFTWQIPISLSILTHLTRHRMHSLIVPSFVPLWNLKNYIIPDTIKNSDFKDKYIDTVEKNIRIFEKYKNIGIMNEDLIYFYLGCQMCNVITTINGRELMWITRMRGCHRAQWQIRDIANSMMDEITKVAPLFRESLGPTCEVLHYCPEGKLSCGHIKDIIKKPESKD